MTKPETTKKTSTPMKPPEIGSPAWYAMTNNTATALSPWMSARTCRRLGVEVAAELWSAIASADSAEGAGAVTMCPRRPHGACRFARAERAPIADARVLA